jgi:hypothetical protein
LIWTALCSCSVLFRSAIWFVFATNNVIERSVCFLMLKRCWIFIALC